MVPKLRTNNKEESSTNSLHDDVVASKPPLVACAYPASNSDLKNLQTADELAAAEKARMDHDIFNLVALVGEWEWLLYWIFMLWFCSNALLS